MNVYEAAQDRLKTVFAEFDNVYVSFSGGKDSGVLLNLAIDYIRQHLPGRRLSVFHLDYEAQYTMTTEYFTRAMSENLDILDVYRCCIPFKVTTCTSMYESYWRPWDQEKKDIWVSPLPANCYTAEDFDFFKPNMWDYEFQELFSKWIHERHGAEKTCCLVGIRTDESLNRWRAIHSDRNYRNYKGINWTKEMYPNIFNGYPIFDWKAHDVWVANARFAWDYNKLYDIFHQAGLSIDQMRVASPFLSTAQDSLKLYRVIEPSTWGKLISRVNGVNFTGLYGGTTAMGWKSIKLPKGHTWKSYMEFLLNTLPADTADNYRKKLETSQEFWRKRGGCLSQDVRDKLTVQGVEFETKSETNYKTDKLPVTMEYLDDIDIQEFQSIPTYKRMCICILKNDHLCKYAGYSLTKAENQMRSEADRKYKEILP